MAELRVSQIEFIAAQATAQTLPFGITAAEVKGVIQKVSGTPTNLTVVSTTPSSGDVQFTGTSTAPSGSLTLGGAAAADTTLVVQYVAPGDMPAAQ